MTGCCREGPGEDILDDRGPRALGQKQEAKRLERQVRPGMQELGDHIRGCGFHLPCYRLRTVTCL